MRHQGLLPLLMLAATACAPGSTLAVRAAKTPTRPAARVLPSPPPEHAAARRPRPATTKAGDEAQADNEPVEEPDYTGEIEEEPLDKSGESGKPGHLGHGTTPPDPLAGWSDKKIEKTLLEDPEALGSMSVGRTNAGALFNGVQMPPGKYWKRVDPAHEWGTRETVDDLIRCIDHVNQELPGAPPMYIGHISARHGGHLTPHISHQSGRDVDVSYYYKPGKQRWYARATRENLDLPRTWAFVRAVITLTDVKLLIIDRSIQKLIKDYALSIGEDPSWLDDIFRGRPGKLRPLIIHATGHRTHIHVRFYSPKAQQRARHVYPLLVKLHLIEPVTYYVTYKVKKGETLIELARRYHTTVRAIQRANGLKSTLIQARKEYRIPRHGGVATAGPLVLSPRRLPPSEPLAERVGTAPGS